MLEIISLIVTIVLGLPGLLILFKNRNTRLIYLENKQINVQEDLLKSFDDLSIKYKDVEITSQLIFIKGVIICDGDKDISSEKNYIEITSQDNSRWVDFKITNKSKGLLGESSFIDDTARVDFELFKTKESIEFEGILEKLEDKKKSKVVDLEFFHRIPNLKEIETLKGEQLKGANKVFLLATFCLAFSVYVLYNEYDINSYSVIPYNSVTNKNISTDVLTVSLEYEKIVQKLKKETNGIFLMFKPSSNYEINYANRLGNFTEATEIASIYFKKELSVFSIVFLIFSFLSILFSALFYFLYFFYLTKKKYLKFIE